MTVFGNSDLTMLSIKLIDSAQSEDIQQYEKTRARFIQQLPIGLTTNEIQPEHNNTFNLWLLGRLVFSDQLQKHPEQLKMAKTLLNGLSTQHIDQSNGLDLGDDSAMYLWAYAYAIAANPDIYPVTMPLNMKDLKMQTNALFLNPHLSDSNKGWIITLDLLAAAHADTPIIYENVKQMIIHDKLIDHIPLAELQSWAWAIACNAAKKMHDIAFFNTASEAYQLSITALQQHPIENKEQQDLNVSISHSTFKGI